MMKRYDLKGSDMAAMIEQPDGNWVSHYDVKKELNIADRIIKLMNEALRLDQEAISALALNRVTCNEQLADHPSIQCGSLPRPKAGEDIQGNTGTTVGLVGILNGIAGVDNDSNGFIAAVIGDDDLVIRFERLRLA